MSNLLAILFLFGCGVKGPPPTLLDDTTSPPQNKYIKGPHQLSQDKNFQMELMSLLELQQKVLSLSNEINYLGPNLKINSQMKNICKDAKSTAISYQKQKVRVFKFITEEYKKYNSIPISFENEKEVLLALNSINKCLQ